MFRNIAFSAIAMVLATQTPMLFTPTSSQSSESLVPEPIADAPSLTIEASQAQAVSEYFLFDGTRELRTTNVIGAIVYYDTIIEDQTVGTRRKIVMERASIVAGRSFRFTSIYLVDDQFVHLRSTTSAFGEYRLIEPPRVILAGPHTEWTVTTDEDIYRYRVEHGTAETADEVYDDVLIVTRENYKNGTGHLATETWYYANGVGLVRHDIVPTDTERPSIQLERQ